MLFSSLVFLYFFLPAVLAGYYLLPPRCRTAFLLLANLVFYGFGEPACVLLMLRSIAINYAGGLCLRRGRGARARRLALSPPRPRPLLRRGICKSAGFLADT
ncbi:MAG: MBOAT family protein, partial [Eubacteriales bacterium]|nr:MBOAT family protein [Eubacteriales bacterium]